MCHRRTDLRTYVCSRNELPEMIASVEPLNSGFALNDPTDPRHQYMTTLKRRFGDFLHRASLSLQQQGEENTVDAVHMLVCLSTAAQIFDFFEIAQRPSDTLYQDLHVGIRR